MMSSSLSDFVKAVNDIDSGTPHSTSSNNSSGYTPPKLKKMGSKILMKLKNKKKRDSNDREEIILPPVKDEEIVDQQYSPENSGFGKYMPLDTSPASKKKFEEYKKAMKKMPLYYQMDESTELGNNLALNNNLNNQINKSDNSSLDENESDDSYTPPTSSRKKSNSIIGFFDGLSEENESNSYEKLNGVPLKVEIEDLKNQLIERGFLDSSNGNSYEDGTPPSNSLAGSPVNHLSTLYYLQKYEHKSNLMEKDHFSLSPPTIMNKLKKKSSSFLDSISSSGNLVSFIGGNNSKSQNVSPLNSYPNSPVNHNVPLSPNRNKILCSSPIFRSDMETSSSDSSNGDKKNQMKNNPIKFEKIFRNFRNYIQDEETIKKVCKFFFFRNFLFEKIIIIPLRKKKLFNTKFSK